MASSDLQFVAETLSNLVYCNPTWQLTVFVPAIEVWDPALNVALPESCTSSKGLISQQLQVDTATSTTWKCKLGKKGDTGFFNATIDRSSSSLVDTDKGLQQFERCKMEARPENAEVGVCGRIWFGSVLSSNAYSEISVDSLTVSDKQNDHSSTCTEQVRGSAHLANNRVQNVVKRKRLCIKNWGP